MGWKSTQNWNDPGATEIREGAPVTSELARKMVNRDLSVLDAPIGLRLQNSNIVANVNSGNARLARIFVPRAAHVLVMECCGGLAAASPLGNNPRAYLYLVNDSAQQVNGDWTSVLVPNTVNAIRYPSIFLFSPLTIGPNHRDRLCYLWCHFEDTITTGTMVLSNNLSPSSLENGKTGYGLRFG